MTAPAPAKLLFELPVRADNRRPQRGRRPIAWGALAHLVPAAILALGLLGYPLGRTVWVSFRAADGGFTVRNYGVLGDRDVLAAIGHNAIWLAASFLVLLIGAALAVLSRRIGRSRTFFVGVIAGPVAVSATASGVAFRLLFDPLPEHGTVAAVVAHVSGWLHPGSPRPQDVPALGPGWIWLVLVSAFAWSWIGLTVLLLRAGLAGTRPELIRMARSFGARPLQAWLSALVPALVPLLPVVLLTVSVAAVRVFDVVLVTAPGSEQHDVNVLGLLLWRSGDLLGTGRAAALAVVFAAAVCVLALFALRLLARTWPLGEPPQPDPAAATVADAAGGPRPAGGQRRAAGSEAWSAWRVRRPGRHAAPRQRRPQRGRWWLLGVVVSLFWLVPLVVLLLTSLRRPQDAAAFGWWHGHGFSLESYRRAYRAGVAGAVWSTLGRAVLATLLTLVCAVPAAHAIARGGLSARAGRWLLRVSVVLAVLPVQALGSSLGQELYWLGLSNTQLALVLVHGALGLPLAVLLLRAAFAGRPPPDRPTFAPRGTRWLAVLGSELTASWLALLAVAVLQFVQVWGDLVVGLVLVGSETGVLSLAVLGQGREFAASAGPVAATAMISVLVPLALVLATGHWVVRGLSAGVSR